MSKDKLPCGYDSELIDCIDCCNFETCELINSIINSCSISKHKKIDNKDCK